MNPDLQRLHPYPFERLSALLEGVTPAELPAINLSIGEPRHPAPVFVLEELTRRVQGYSYYPKTAGIPALRDSIAAWLKQRYGLRPGSITAPAHILPVNGTREALFAFAQCIVDRQRDPAAAVAMPNPFYQIYEGAALLAGAEPVFIPERPDRPGVPDFAQVEVKTWERCQLVYVCSPGNPSGAVLGEQDWRLLFDLADRHDFVIASDECYSEIFFDESQPPIGVLQACQLAGRMEFQRCIAFHSLSKRSSLPGLRSGFVAGDPSLIRRFLLYRTYHGCAMPHPVQHASALAWSDEVHVIDNRTLYRAKFAAVLKTLDGCLDVRLPEGGFYLWPRVPLAATTYARELFRTTHVTVLPGSFLSRPTAAGDPGADRIRIALVAELEECLEAARRIRAFTATL